MCHGILFFFQRDTEEEGKTDAVFFLNIELKRMEKKIPSETICSLKPFLDSFECRATTRNGNVLFVH